MQVERLLKMIFYIINHNDVTANELAEHFDVSTRTIYRDIDTLTLIGIPIITTKGSGGGISLVGGYTIDKSVLSKEEQQTVYQGLQVLQATNIPNAQEALHKIGSVFRQPAQNKWLEVDFTYWGNEERDKNKFSDLQHAILNKLVVEFQYFNSELQVSIKTIEPLRLLFRSHAWYLLGYCQTRGEVRTYRLSRIRDLKITAHRFVREYNEESPSLQQQDPSKSLLLKLKFSSSIIHKVYDYFNESQMQIMEDGSCIVEGYYELNHWLFHYLLSFGEHVEILEPKKAREMLREKAKEIYKIYE